MQGRDLAVVLDADEKIRDGALFGVHGGHVNVTDGRYVYMRAPAEPSNSPLEEYTLTPTHMRGRFAVAELKEWEPAEPFRFTKDLRTMRMPSRTMLVNAWQHGTLLFDLESDPRQEHPLVDDQIELRMLRLLARLMSDNEAPRSQFERLGIPYDVAPDSDHLLVRQQAERAAATLEALPDLATLPARASLEMLIAALVKDSHARAVLERHVPSVVEMELAPPLSLLDMAATARITAAALRAVAEDLAAAQTASASAAQRKPV
jgi:hypothetical protein